MAPVRVPPCGAVSRLCAMLRRRTRHPDSSPAVPGYDPFAAEALSYSSNLYGAALRLTRNAADAEDLVQDTYVRAFRAADQFQRGTNLKAWLFTILHNAFRNLRRDASRDPVEV